MLKPFFNWVQKSRFLALENVDKSRSFFDRRVIVCIVVGQSWVHLSRAVKIKVRVWPWLAEIFFRARRGSLPWNNSCQGPFRVLKVSPARNSSLLSSVKVYWLVTSTACWFHKLVIVGSILSDSLLFFLPLGGVSVSSFSQMRSEL